MSYSGGSGLQRESTRAAVSGISYRRTILLAVLATASLMWSAVHHFGVPSADMAWLLAYSALGVLAIAVFAAASVALLLTLRVLWRKLRGKQP